MTAPHRAPLDDGALEDVGEPVERDRGLGELLGDHRQRRRGRAADPEGEMPGVAAHDGHEEPPLGGGRVLHEVADQLRPEVARRREAEGHDLAGQRQVVVDRLRHVSDGEPRHGLGEP